MDEQQTHMIYFYVGTGKTRETFTSAGISLSLSSIRKYIASDAVTSQSLFSELLRSTESWQLQWIKEGKGDKSVKKNGKHSSKCGPMIHSDEKLEDIGKHSQHKAICFQIVFEETKFQEWEQEQQLKNNIPTATIMKCEEISNHLKIVIDYPKEQRKYQVCYKIYENNNDNSNAEWQSLEDGSNEILISKLWKFQQYTLEIALKNKYSGVYGKSTIKKGIEIKSNQLVFEGASNEDILVLNEKQEFEMFNHKELYTWCRTELLRNSVFDDIRNMKYGGMTITYLLVMIEHCEVLDGKCFLFNDVSSKYVIDQLLGVEEGKKYRQENTNNENKDAFSSHLCLSLLSRLRVLAFKSKTKLGYVPSNPYVIHFWCFFHEKPASDIYIRCSELSLS